MHKIWSGFWAWYEKHYAINITLSLGLFLLQLVHLVWLTMNVVVVRLLEHSFWEFTGIWEYIIVAVDYTEIPALISVSLIYIHALQKRFQWRSIIYLVFLNSQWLHLFWITDEFVIHTFLGEPHGGTILPAWLAWVAICIDYLELPVIADTFSKVGRALSQGKKIVLS
jgi:hypothetical protein